MTDKDLMPFGKYGKQKDGRVGRKMEDVPASYLIWLYDQPWINEWPDVKQYIDDNYHILEKEVEGK